MKKLLTLLTVCFMLTSCASAGTKSETSSENTAPVTAPVTDNTVQETNVPDEPKEDIVLTMGVIAKDESYIEEEIRAFNEADNGYRIELKNYATDEIREKGLSRETGAYADFNVIQNIINSDEIDIITSHTFVNNAKFDILKKREAFADLYQFMENDEEVNRETLNSRILKMLESDGKLYCIPSRYMVGRTLIGKKEYVGDTENWTVDEFIERWNAMPEGSTVNGCTNSENIYYDVLRYNIESFVDYENATVNFDCEEFRKMLEFCNQFPSNQGQKGEMDFNNPQMVETYDISGFARGAGAFNDEYTVVGMPTLDRQGSFLESEGGYYAINANSSPEKQRGAWEFIRSFLTVEGLMTDYIERYENWDGSITYSEDYGFPINNEAFEMQMQDMIDGKYSYMYEPSGGDIAEGFTAHMCNIADPEQCKKLVEYLESIDRWETSLDDALWLITTEETLAYFAGELTLDECVGNIQTRASIWISEQS